MRKLSDDQIIKEVQRDRTVKVSGKNYGEPIDKEVTFDEVLDLLSDRHIESKREHFRRMLTGIYREANDSPLDDFIRKLRKGLMIKFQR